MTGELNSNPTKSKNQETSRFAKFLKSGLFWTFVFGIVGIIIAIIFYQWSDKKREPLYTIKKTPTLIFDKDNSSPNIQLITKDSTIIEDNVYVTNIVIWNNGSLEIKGADVRKTFKVGYGNNAQILDFKIVEETHPNISNFKVAKEIDKEELLIDWDYFDPGFGFELQIIYSGNPIDFYIEGYVLEAQLKQVSKAENNNVIILSLIFSLLFTLGSIFFVYNKVFVLLEEKWKFNLLSLTGSQFLLFVSAYIFISIVIVFFFMYFLGDVFFFLFRNLMTYHHIPL